MQIMIEIPEKLACEGFERSFTEEEKNILIKAIGNGTPLPKGHGRLIDADKINIPPEEMIAKMVVHYTPTVIEADKERV